MGFWKSGMFHLYFVALLFLGKRRIDRLIRIGKRLFGHTPVIGAVYKGASR
jgi:hypothetical protein